MMPVKQPGRAELWRTLLGQPRLPPPRAEKRGGVKVGAQGSDLGRAASFS